jgi:hypothetical protein
MIIPIRCKCIIDDSVTAVLTVHHVFFIGTRQVHSRYYYINGLNNEYAMKLCHDEALLPLRIVLEQYGMTSDDEKGK